MDITSVIAYLRSEREGICNAILALERLLDSQTKTTRGRPKGSRPAKATAIQGGLALGTAAGAKSDEEQAQGAIG
jgi:hypothetical protein